MTSINVLLIGVALGWASAGVVFLAWAIVRIGRGDE